MVAIIPSIPTSDPDELHRLLAMAEGVVDRISIDIVDGKFAANKTIDPSILSDIETDLKFDYQLMVIEPVNWIERCLRGQADRIIGQIEHMSDQKLFLEKVFEHGISAGLALDLTTEAARIDEDLLNELDVVLLMSVPAGFGGQPFDKSVLEKIEKFAKVRTDNNYSYKIHVDGGITTENIGQIAKLGADEVSIGKRIFEGDLKENLEKFSNG